MIANNKLQLKIRTVGDVISKFWLDHYSSIFVLVLLVVVSAGGYIWYLTMYQSGWSNEQKDAFMTKQHQDVNFQEQRFRDTLTNIEKRKAEHNMILAKPKGIFLLEE